MKNVYFKRFLTAVIAIFLLLPFMASVLPLGDDNQINEEQKINLVDASKEFIRTDDVEAKVAIGSKIKLSNDNINKHVSVIDSMGNNISVRYKDGYILPPTGGYTEGLSYKISLSNEVNFLEPGLSTRKDVTLKIDREEVFEHDFNDEVIHISHEDVISYDGSILTLRKGNFKSGQVVVFNNPDFNKNGKITAKIVSQNNSDDKIQLNVVKPELDEVFDNLNVSYKYKIGENDLEIYEENIRKMVKSDPFFGQYFLDYLEELPQLNIDISFEDDTLTMEIYVRIRLKEFAESNFRIGSFVGENNLNAYIVFKIIHSKSIEVQNDINTSTATFEIGTTISSETRYGVYLEIDGVIKREDELEDGGSEGELFTNLNGFSKELFQHLENVFEEIGEDHNSVEKETLIAKFYASYMGIIGVGVDINLVLDFSFSGSLGVEYVTSETVSYWYEKNQNNGDGEAFENKEVSTSDGWNFYLRGMAETRFGLQVEAYIDLLFIFRAGIRVEAGIFAAGGGAISYSTGYVENVENEDGIEQNEYESKFYKAAYFEMGFYAKASLFIEANFIFIKPNIEHTFASYKLNFLELGSRDSIHLSIPNLPEDNTYILTDDNREVEVPSISVKTVDIFEGTSSVVPANLGENVALIYDSDHISISNNKINVVNPHDFDEHEILIVLYNDDFLTSFIDPNTSVNGATFGLNIPDNIDSKYVADVIKLKIVNNPIDVVDFEADNYEELDGLPRGSSIGIYAHSFVPLNSSFFEMSYTILNPTEGVSIDENGVLSATSNVSLGTTIDVLVETKKNIGNQVSKIYSIDIIDAIIEMINFNIIDELTMEPTQYFGTVAQGALLRIGTVVFPEYANSETVDILVISGEEYYEYYDASNSILKIKDSVPHGSIIRIQAKYNNIIMEELDLFISGDVINTVEIVCDDYVYRGDIKDLNVCYTPINLISEPSIYYRLEGISESHAYIRNDNKLVVSNTIPFGMKLKLIAEVNGRSIAKVLTVKEKIAEEVEVLANGCSSLSIGYEEEITLTTSIYPNNVDNNSFDIEVIQGKEHLNVITGHELFGNNNSGLRTFSLKYNTPRNEEIIIKMTKKINTTDGVQVLESEVSIISNPLVLHEVQIVGGVNYLSPNLEREIRYSFSNTDGNIHPKKAYIENAILKVTKGEEYVTFRRERKVDDTIYYGSEIDVLPTDIIKLIVNSCIGMNDREIIIELEVEGEDEEIFFATMCYEVLMIIDDVIIDVEEVFDYYGNTLEKNYSNGTLFAEASDAVLFDISVNPSSARIEEITWNVDPRYGYFDGMALYISNSPSIFSTNEVAFDVYATVRYLVYNETTGVFEEFVNSNRLLVVITKKEVVQVDLVETVNITRPNYYQDSNGNVRFQVLTSTLQIYNDCLYVNLGDTFTLDYNVTPMNATFRDNVTYNVNYPGIDIYDGRFYVDTYADINISCQITITIDGVSKILNVYIGNATLDLFIVESNDALVHPAGSTIVLPTNKDYSSNSPIFIRTYPDYYVLEYGISYYVYGEDAYLDDNVLHTSRAYNNSSCYIDLEVFADGYGCFELVQIKLYQLYWNNPDITEVDRGSDILLDNNYFGFTRNKDIINYIPVTAGFQVIKQGGSYYLRVDQSLPFGRAVTVYAYLDGMPNYEISKTFKVKRIEHLEINLPNPSFNAPWTVEEYAGGYIKVYPMLHGYFITDPPYSSNAATDTLNITGLGYLSGGRTIPLSGSVSIVEGSRFATLENSNRVRMRGYDDYSTNDRIIVKIICEGLTQYLMIRIFYPATFFTNDDLNAFNKEPNITPKQLGLMFDFKNKITPFYTESSNPVVFIPTYTYEYSVSSDGIWTANYSRSVTQFEFQVSVKIVNYYLLRRFSEDFIHTYTFQSPIYLYKAQDVYKIRNNKSGTYFLRNDIDLGSTYSEWNPDSFDGYLKGNSFKINNFSISGNRTEYGLFTQIGSNGTIENLTVDGTISTSENTTNQYAGTIAGINYGMIKSCYALGNSNVTYNASTQSYSGWDIKGNSKDSRVGGVVGVNYGTIIWSVNRAMIVGSGNTGGIAGENYGTVYACDNHGTIRYFYKGANSCIGGISGYQEGSTIGGSHVVWADIYYDNPSSESIELAPYIGSLIGYRIGGTISSGTRYTNIYVGTLHVVRWTEGMLWWTKHREHDQAKNVETLPGYGYWEQS